MVMASESEKAASPRWGERMRIFMCVSEEVYLYVASLRPEKQMRGFFAALRMTSKDNSKCNGKYRDPSLRSG